MITINVTFDPKFTPAQIAKLSKAVELWQTSWNSDAFKPQVLAASFQQTNDNSAKVFATITAVQEKHLILMLNEVANGSETASTNTVTGVTTIQIAYLDNPNTSVFDIVNTISHEYTHTPEGGAYTHSYLYSRWLPWTRGRPYSVPYQIGDITEELAQSI